jgi:regulatory helix-turn-helix LysR family protein
VHSSTVVIATGGFAEASQRLHVTQSNVSTRIQRLEETLGAVCSFGTRHGRLTEGHNTDGLNGLDPKSFDAAAEFISRAARALPTRSSPTCDA